MTFDITEIFGRNLRLPAGLENKFFLFFRIRHGKTAGLPAARDSATPNDSAMALVASFSPLALVCAALIVATGALTSFLHLGSVTDLVTTGWGRLLSLKLIAAIVIIVFGARNFLHLKPRLDQPDGPEALRRSAVAELAVGGVLLLITAFLVATAPPAEEHDMAMADTASTVETRQR